MANSNADILQTLHDFYSGLGLLVVDSYLEHSLLQHVDHHDQVFSARSRAFKLAFCRVVPDSSNPIGMSISFKGAASSKHMGRVRSTLAKTLLHDPDNDKEFNVHESELGVRNFKLPCS